MHYSPKPTTHSSLIEFEIRLIVAGSRLYDDYKYFSETMFEFIQKFKDKSIIFISGKARTGADDMIIRWCIEHRLPWAEFPADWGIGRSAGYIRNTEMSNVATDLIVFYDGSSPGTGHMIDIAYKKKLNVTTVLIDPKE